MSRFAGSRSRWGRTYRSLAALALAATTVVGFHAAPAAANTTGKKVHKPSCSHTWDNVYRCNRLTEAWSTNSSDPNVLGSRGAYQRMTVYYTPSVFSHYETQLSTRALVYDSRSNATVHRLRMSETYKALGSGGGSLSVGWGVFSYSPDDTVEVSSNLVYFAMTRAGIKSMSSNRSLGFPHNGGVAKVEQVSNSTIEYPTSNTSHRLLSQSRLTDY